MTSRRVFNPSITKAKCRCKYLEAAAAEPENPITFDPVTHEYNFVYRSRNEGICSLVIRHCPWCGGRAPRGKRAPLFATITRAEERRLRGLGADIRTLSQAIAKLGKPDEDMPEGIGSMRLYSEKEPTTSHTYRVIRYNRLSKTVIVELVDYGPEHGVKMTLQGKYIGPKRAAPIKKPPRAP